VNEALDALGKRGVEKNYTRRNLMTCTAHQIFFG
jgi:hypothetical protein